MYKTIKSDSENNIICNHCKCVGYDSSMNGYCNNPKSVYYRKAILRDFNNFTIQCANFQNDSNK